MPKFCEECGTKLKPGSKFCDECGYNFSKGVQTPGGGPRRSALQSIGLIFLFLLVFLMVVGFLASVSDNTENKASPTQNPATATPSLNPTLQPAGDLNGRWEGSITFTNNCANPACRYTGRMNPPSLVMQLQQNGGRVTGTVTIYPQNFDVQELVAGQGCAAFRSSGVSTTQVNNGVYSASRFTFTDSAGNAWSLNAISSGLQGTVSSNVAGCLGISSKKVALTRAS